MADQTFESWAREKMALQPVFESEEDAINRAMETAADDLCEVWQEPDGGRFIICELDAREIANGMGYERIANVMDLVDMKREKEKRGR